MNPRELESILHELLDEYRAYQFIGSYYGQESIEFDGDEAALVEKYVDAILEEF